MAVNLENLIDLPLLTHYDEQLKKWVVNRIGKTLENVVFTTRSELPVEGKVGILYVVETSILKWNGAQYVDVGNPPQVAQSTLWNKLK